MQTMKVKIRTEDFHFSMPIPTALIRVVIRLTPDRVFQKMSLKTPEPYCNFITKENISMIIIECLDIFKEYKGLEIVHVEANDGTFVSIKL